MWHFYKEKQLNLEREKKKKLGGKKQKGKKKLGEKQNREEKKGTWRKKTKERKKETLEKKKQKREKKRNLRRRKKQKPREPPCQTPGALDRRWLGITGGLVTYPVILLASEFPKESYRHIGYRLRKPRCTREKLKTVILFKEH